MWQENSFLTSIKPRFFTVLGDIFHGAGNMAQYTKCIENYKKVSTNYIIILSVSECVYDT